MQSFIVYCRHEEELHSNKGYLECTAVELLDIILKNVSNSKIETPAEKVLSAAVFHFVAPNLPNHTSEPHAELGGEQCQLCANQQAEARIKKIKFTNPLQLPLPHSPTNLRLSPWSNSVSLLVTDFPQ